MISKQCQNGRRKGKTYKSFRETRASTTEQEKTKNRLKKQLRNIKSQNYIPNRTYKT